MSEKIKFDEMFFHSGIGTGDGIFDGKSPVFLCIKAQSDQNGKAYVMPLCDKDFNFNCLDVKLCEYKFPFSYFEYEKEDFPAKIKLCAFSPFIPNSDTDSGIPAIAYEMEIVSTSDKTLSFGVAAKFRKVFENAQFSCGCGDGAKDVYCEMTHKNGAQMCISTDSNDFSLRVCDDIARTSPIEFLYGFEKNDGIVKDVNECSNDFVSDALVSEFVLKPSGKIKVKFVVSHYSKNVDGFDSLKPFYTQYFDSARECNSYFFLHYDRLFEKTLEFSKVLCKSGFDESAKNAVIKSFDALREIDMVRLSTGLFLNPVPNDLYYDFAFFTLSKASFEYDLKRSVFAIEEKTLSAEKVKERVYNTINKAYYIHLLNAFFGDVVEDWYYISKCCDYVCENLDENNIVQSDKLCLYQSIKLSEYAKDKKRFSEYKKVYDKFFDNENFDVRFRESRDSALWEITKISGFEYNGFENTVFVNPDMKNAKDGVFRCVFFAGETFGYIERGVDYIEINVKSGVLNVRNVFVPKTPRMVLYGGRKWKFEAKGLCTCLDSTLKITPDKKLTVIIDAN